MIRIRVWPIPPWWARRCPFCTLYDGRGVDEATLWEHLAVMHDAADQVAAVFAEIDADWLDDVARGRRP